MTPNAIMPYFLSQRQLHLTLSILYPTTYAAVRKMVSSLDVLQPKYCVHLPFRAPQSKIQNDWGKS
jgi:hypothetical protein